jgi:hypothetical protein
MQEKSMEVRLYALLTDQMSLAEPFFLLIQPPVTLTLFCTRRMMRAQISRPETQTDRHKKPKGTEQANFQAEK